MAFPRNPHEFISRLHNRVLLESARGYLSLRKRLGGCPFIANRGSIRLPFYGDGDLQELHYYVYGKEYWNKEFRALSPYLVQGGVAIDVGANQGFMSGILSILSGAAGRVYSFEPSPKTYDRLLSVISANKYSNVSPYNLGCGSTESVMTLYHPLSFSGHATLRPDAMEEGEKDAAGAVDVRIVKLDDFLGPKLDRLDFFKVDVEGFEDEVLAGATGLLKRFKPVIYIELCKQFVTSSQKAIGILHNLGYTIDHESEFTESLNGTDFIALPPGYQSPTSGNLMAGTPPRG